MVAVLLFASGPSLLILRKLVCSKSAVSARRGLPSCCYCWAVAFCQHQPTLALLSPGGDIGTCGRVLGPGGVWYFSWLFIFIISPYSFLSGRDSRRISFLKTNEMRITVRGQSMSVSVYLKRHLCGLVILPPSCPERYLSKYIRMRGRPLFILWVITFKQKG